MELIDRVCEFLGETVSYYSWDRFKKNSFDARWFHDRIPSHENLIGDVVLTGIDDNQYIMIFHGLFGESFTGNNKYVKEITVQYMSPDNIRVRVNRQIKEFALSFTEGNELLKTKYAR